MQDREGLLYHNITDYDHLLLYNTHICYNVYDCGIIGEFTYILRM